MAGRRELLPADRPLFGSRGSGSYGGVRDGSGSGVPYVDDPLRVRASEFVPQGYLRTGYDTGRVW